MKKQLIMMLALALTFQTAGAQEKKGSEKPKTELTKEQKKAAKKLKKEQQKKQKLFKANRVYTLTSKRGGVVLNGGGTGLDADKNRKDAPDSTRQFAVVYHNGGLFLYSPAAKKFLLNDGTFGKHLGDPFNFDKKNGKGQFKYMISTPTGKGEKLFLNLTDKNQVVLNNNATPDDGNRWQLKEAGKFDPKEAQQIAKIPSPKGDGKTLRRPGLFNVSKTENNWFFEIPDSLIGRDFLTTTRYISTPAGSGEFGGELLNQQTVYFQPGINNQLLLRVRLLVNVSDSTQAINKAITVSNENPIIASFKIESHKGGFYKIKVNDFLGEDNATTGINRPTKTQFSLSNVVGNLSYIEDIKSFPLNTEVRMVKTYNSSSTRLASARNTGKVTFGINLSFVLLPSDPMKPRYFDPRVGYFTHGYNSYNDQQQRVEQKVYISRWRLEPKPEDVEKMQRGELVEPQKPIVYYIDPATPKQWRKYLIAGVNDWQKAFEKAGFKNAIRAEEWPEGKDSIMSMEDARYSVIRYLASPIENAYGPHVSDPRTGEILESHICWYHNVMSLLHDWYMVQASSIDEAARKMNYDEELMGQLIRFVSSHEVGHTLGLRHNFGSSSTVPVEKLRDKAWVAEHGHTPSIMDYARFNYVAQPEDGLTQTEIFPRINDYDCWAIEWGYTPMFDAETPEADHKALEALFQKENVAKNPRLWWGDGETYNDDPRRQTEDLGDDAVKASEYGIKNLKRELLQLPAWTYDEKDIYNENLETMYSQIRNQFLRYCGHVINNIGGQLENFRTNAEEGDVYRPQPRQKQLDALKYVERNILNEPTWLRTIPYVKRLTPNPERLTQIVAEYGVARLIGRSLSLNEEYKAEEYFADLTRLIMKDVAQANLSTYHQTLQREYVRGLTGRLNTDRIRPYVLQTLKQLQRRLAGISTPHAQALKDTIDRALIIK